LKLLADREKREMKEWGERKRKGEAPIIELRVYRTIKQFVSSQE